MALWEVWRKHCLVVWHHQYFINKLLLKRYYFQEPAKLFAFLRGLQNLVGVVYYKKTLASNFYHDLKDTCVSVISITQKISSNRNSSQKGYPGRITTLSKIELGLLNSSCHLHKPEQHPTLHFQQTILKINISRRRKNGKTKLTKLMVWNLGHRTPKRHVLSCILPKVSCN